jgi:hypothetical protein
MSPETIQRKVYWMGDSSAQCLLNRKRALRSESVTAAMDTPADSRGEVRVKTIIKTKAANGSNVISMAAIIVGSYVPDEVI